MHNTEYKIAVYEMIKSKRYSFWSGDLTSYSERQVIRASDNFIVHFVRNKQYLRRLQYSKDILYAFSSSFVSIDEPTRQGVVMTMAEAELVGTGNIFKYFNIKDRSFFYLFRLTFYIENHGLIWDGRYHHETTQR